MLGILCACEVIVPFCLGVLEGEEPGVTLASWAFGVDIRGELVPLPLTCPEAGPGGAVKRGSSTGTF